jgi:hypothetical protein
MVVYAYNTGTLEVEVGESRVQVWAELQAEFKASLGYIVKLFLKTPK